MLSEIPSKIIKNPGRFAVLLNANAKRWTGDLHEAVSRWVTSRDLFLTTDFRQAEKTVDRLIKEGYTAIFTGGGDGTIMYLLNAVEQRIRDGMVKREDAPYVGVLRMGTGNAIASYLGSQNIVDDLRLLSQGSPLSVYSVKMVEGDEGLFPFAGFGWDAMIVNDYETIKDTVRDTALENYVTGLGGYAAAVMTRTIPTAVKTPAVPIRMTNVSGTALRVGDNNEIIDELGPGEILFEGPARVFGVGSIPNWGFDIRMFPHCHLDPDRFELRIYDGSVRWIIANLPRFWRGELQQGHHWDYLATDVRCELLGEPLQYQVSGDGRGFQTDVTWKIAEYPAQLAVPLR